MFLLLQVHFNASSRDLDAGDSRLLLLRICLHLIDLRILWQPALLVVMSLIDSAFIDLGLAYAGILALSNHTKRFILSHNIIINGEATLLQRLEHVLLIEIEEAFLEHVLRLQVETAGGDDLSRVQHLVSVLLGLGSLAAWR